jgi:cytoskeletal protein RodZ
MHLKKSHKTRTIVIVVIAVLFVLSGGALLYWYSLTQTPINNQPDQSIVDTNDSSHTDSANYTGREADKEPLQNDSANVDQDSLTAYITTKNVIGNQLQIRIQIEQYVSSGSCKITIGDYSAQADIVQNPSSSSCAGWDIPLSQLATGRQAIVVDIISNDKSAVITDEVSI